MFGYLYSCCEQWRRDCRAATGLEYGLLAGGIALAVLLAVLLLGNDLDGLFRFAGDTMQEASEQYDPAPEL